MLLSIGIYLTIGLILATLAIMLIFGLRNLGRSSENKLVLASFALPLIVAALMIAIYKGDWIPGLIMTAVVLMGLAFVLLIVTAVQRFVR